MPSEWAIKAAQNIVRPLKDRIYREMSAKDYDEPWDRIAEALDAARIEGLEEAARIAEKCQPYTFIDEHTSARDHALINGRIDGVQLATGAIRARIKEIKA